MRSVLVVSTLVLGSGACLGTPPSSGAIDGPIDAPELDAPVDAGIDAELDAPMCRDEDGDGWTVDCGGADPAQVDCNDQNPAVHPGAHDSPGVDHDCNPGTPTAAEAFRDLTVNSFGGTGREITTRFGRYRLTSSAGHQLGSVAVERLAGGLSEELIYAGPLLELFSGVHVWDDFFSVQPDASSLGDLDPTHVGPVVYQTTVTWRDGGDAVNPSLAGTSTYTFTIDGRIVRTDQFELFAQPVHVDDDFPGITSHVSLSARSASGATQLDTLVVRDLDDGVLSVGLPVTGPGVGHNTLGQPHQWQWSCALGAEVEVGFAAVIPDFGDQPTRTMRATSNLSTNPVYRQIALQYDWQQGVGGPPATLTLGEQRGHFLISPRGRSGSNCQTIDQQVMAYLAPPSLTFGGPATGESVTSDPDDENDDGYVESGGYWVMRAFEPTGLRFAMAVQAGTTVPPHALFRIRDVPQDRDPLVYIDGVRMTHGQHYRLQAADTNGIWLAVVSGLPAGHEVELIYPEPCSAACTP